MDSQQLSQYGFYGKVMKPRNELVKDNINIARKLANVKPVIGNLEDWDKHYASFMEGQKRVSHFENLIQT